MTNHKIITDNLNENTSIINEDSFIHEEVLDIFREEQEKLEHMPKRSRCNFYILQQQENGITCQ